MIEGLFIELASSELKQHLAERAKYHKDRSKWYAEQIATLRAGLQASNISNNPIDSLERSAKRHKERFAYFTFMAEHLIPDETYRLSENDLNRIELVDAYD